MLGDHAADAIAHRDAQGEQPACPHRGRNRRAPPEGAIAHTQCAAGYGHAPAQPRDVAREPDRQGTPALKPALRAGNPGWRQVQRLSEAPIDQRRPEATRCREQVRRSEHDQQRESEPGCAQGQGIHSHPLAEIPDADLGGHRHGDTRFLEIDPGNRKFHADLLLDTDLESRHARRETGLRHGDGDGRGEQANHDAEDDAAGDHAARTMGRVV